MDCALVGLLLEPGAKRPQPESGIGNEVDAFPVRELIRTIGESVGIVAFEEFVEVAEFVTDAIDLRACEMPGRPDNAEAALRGSVNQMGSGREV
jgi:hypothetical protein